MNNVYEFNQNYKELENEINNPRIFKVGISGIYMIGHSIMDSICKSFDLRNWEQVESFDDCILAQNEEIKNYMFNNQFVEAVENFNIPLRLDLKVIDCNQEELNDKIFKFDELLNYKLNLIISYSENSNIDLRKQLSDFLNCNLIFKNGNLTIV